MIQPAFGWAGRFCPWTFVDCFRPCLHFPVFPSSFQVYFCLCCERYKFAREISRRCEARLSRFWTGAPTSSAPIFFFFGEQSFLREPPGWLAGPGDRGGLGLGHGHGHILSCPDLDLVSVMVMLTYWVLRRHSVGAGSTWQTGGRTIQLVRSGISLLRTNLSSEANPLETQSFKTDVFPLFFSLPSAAEYWSQSENNDI